MQRRHYRRSFTHLGILILLALPIALGVLFHPCFGAEDPVVAVVDNASIRRSQVDRAANDFQKLSRKQELTPEERKEILKGLIRRQLILKHKEVEALRQDPAIARQVREYEDNLVISRFLQDRVGQSLDVGDKELKAFYQAHITQFASPPKVRASHILLRTRADAEVVLEKLKGGGNFAALAKKYSIDLPMALEGGSMGVIQKGRTLPEIEKALFLLKEGEISDIVETRFGFHILTVDEITGEKFRSFEEVKEDIRRVVLKEKEAKAFDQMASELEKTAAITIYEDRSPRTTSP